VSEPYVGQSSVRPVDDQDNESSPEVEISIDDVGSSAWSASVAAWPADSFDEGDVVVILLDAPHQGHHAKGRVSAQSPTSLTIYGFGPFGT
jgi:hypothetical protein